MLLAPKGGGCDGYGAVVVVVAVVVVDDAGVDVVVCVF